MNSDTIHVYYWRGRNPHDFQWVIMNDHTEELAHRLAAILHGDNGVNRTEVVVSRFVGNVPTLTRTETNQEGDRRQRTGNFIQDHRDSWHLDPFFPYTEVTL